MNNNEKLELVTRLVVELGLSGNDVVSYLMDKGISFQEYKMPTRILPGMYVYTDGLIHPEIIPGRQIKAIVGYVKECDVLAVCLHEKKLSWALDKQGHLTAYQWCREYAENGVKPQEAFLASHEQWEKVAKAFEVINSALTALGMEKLAEDGYWTSGEKSSEYDRTDVFFCLPNGKPSWESNWYCLDIPLRVRPFIQVRAHY